MKNWKHIILAAMVVIFAACDNGIIPGDNGTKHSGNGTNTINNGTNSGGNGTNSGDNGTDPNGSSNGGETPTPTADDFIFDSMSQAKDAITEVTITPKAGKSNGTITIYYNGSTTLPTTSGAYTVTFDVAAASGWKAAAGLSAGTLRISDEIIGSIDGLAAYLSGKPANTRNTPYVIALNIDNEADFTRLKTTLLNAEYVYLDLSGSTVTSIPNDAFKGCSSLTGIAIPNSVTSIGEWAFANCNNLTSVTIPNSVTSIGNSAFGACGGLTSITIPDSVTSIGWFAFSSCWSLTEINVDSGNTNYSSDNGVLYNKNKTTLIVFPGGKTGAFTIPSSVTSIGLFAFWYCDRLTSVTIPNSVTSIEGAYAFQYCNSLTEINVDSGNTNYSSDNGVLYNKNKTTLIVFPGGKTGAFTIPSSVTSIGNRAFDGCSSLTSVTIPDSVTSIGEWAFAYCYNLTEINVDTGNSSYSSENGVLYNKDKSSLILYPAGKTETTFTIPNSVTSIGEDAFYGCDLTSVTIPDSVTNIGKSAFHACWSLTSVTFQGTITAANFSDSFYGDLREKYLAGGIGTYTTTAPVDEDSVWTK